MPGHLSAYFLGFSPQANESNHLIVCAHSTSLICLYDAHSRLACG